MTRNVKVALGALVVVGSVACDFVVANDTTAPRIDRVVGLDAEGSMFSFTLYSDAAVATRWPASDKVPQLFTSYRIFFNKVLDGCTVIGGATQPDPADPTATKEICPAVAPPVKFFEDTTELAVQLLYDTGRHSLDVTPLKADCRGDSVPLAGLTPGKTYKISVGAGMKDFQGQEIAAKDFSFTLSPIDLLAVWGTDDIQVAQYLFKADAGYVPEMVPIKDNKNCPGVFNIDPWSPEAQASCEGNVQGAYFVANFAREVACDFVDEDNDDLRDKHVKLLDGTTEVPYTCDVYCLNATCTVWDSKTLVFYPKNSLEADKDYKFQIDNTLAGGCGGALADGDVLAAAKEITFKTPKFGFEVTSKTLFTSATSLPIAADNSTSAWPGTTVDVSFSLPVDDATVISGFKLVDDTGAAVALADTGGVVVTDHYSATLTPKDPLTRGKTYTASLTDVKSAAGTALPPETWSFTITLFRPTAASPADNARNVGLPLSALTVTYNGTVDPATVGPDSVALLQINADGSTAIVPSQIRASGTKILIDTDVNNNPITYKKKFEIRVTDAIKEAVTGNVTSTTWRSGFAMVSEFRGTLAGNENASTNPTWNVAFTGPLDATTWTAANVVLTKDSDTAEPKTPIALVLTVPAATTGRVNVVAPLANNERYTLTVSTAVKDTTNPVQTLSAAITAKFRTKCAAPDDYCAP